MRYIINDDDVENWHERLVKINEVYKNDELDYIINEIKNEIDGNIEEIKRRIDNQKNQ